MSIRKIPSRYLNTTIHIFRESAVTDAVGDQDVTKELAYYSVETNIQPQESEAEFEYQGKVHRQTHAARLNKVKNSVIREIKTGDIVLDEETGMSYIVLGVEVLQAASRNISDSHHIKLILKHTTGYFDNTKFKTMTVKAKIV